MTLDSRGAVSVVMLVVYTPTALLAAVICFHHGFQKSSGWFYTLLLCLMRIASSICQLLLETQTPTKSLVEAALITDSVGISPLLLATLGLLSRLWDFINCAKPSGMNARVFIPLHLVIVLGLILSIVGGTSASVGANDTINFGTSSKVGDILYIAGYFIEVAIWFIALPRLSNIPSRERRVAWAVCLSLPFLLIRLAYSALTVFAHDNTWNLLDGSVAAWGCMSVLMEFIVIVIYLTLGFMLDQRDSGRKDSYARRSVNGRGSNNYAVSPPYHQPA